MKVTGTASARWIPDRRAVGLYITLDDVPVVQKLFDVKARREQKDGGDVGVTYTLEVSARERTFKQQAAIWALLKIMFVSMNDYSPTHDELYDLYLDVLDLYANKRPNRFTGALRPVHLSESNVEDAARLIEGIMGALADFCDLSLDAQSEVKKIFVAWQEHRGGMKLDPLDYDDDGKPLSELAWREKHKVSDASGIGGRLELAHIVSRGANTKLIDNPENWLMLTYEEHRLVQHQNGWDEFLERYPHLRGRVLRARNLVSQV